MKLKHVRLIGNLAGGVAILLALLSEYFSLPLLMFLALGIALAALFFEFLFLRCPHCGRHLGQQNRWWHGDAFCPRCGKRIEEDETIS